MKTLSVPWKGLFVAIVASAAVAAVLAPKGMLQRWDQHFTDNAYVRGDITLISPKVAGHVVEVAVRDNQSVNAGDLLFRIDGRDYQARLNQAVALLSSRQAAIGNLEARLDLQGAVIGQAVAALGEAKSEASHANRDTVRARRLIVNRLIANSQLDQIASTEQLALTRVAQMQANLAAAHQQVVVLESQRAQVLAEINAAQSAVDLAALDFHGTAVRAPTDGRVNERQARVGQYVRPGTQLIALVSKELWVVANFKETQLLGMRRGAPVDVSIDALPEVVFKGRLESFSPASGSEFALLAPDNATGNFTRLVRRIPVRITLLRGQPEIIDLRPGMSATATVH